MLNASASHAGKQAGQQLALDMSGSWKADVLVELSAWLADRRDRGELVITIEQFRAQAVNQPQSHKAWGALPGIACKAGFIEPVLHDDGSPVMRRAESVKTHAHAVRLWRLASSFFAPAAGTQSPTHDHLPAEACNRQEGIARVSDGRHSHCGGVA